MLDKKFHYLTLFLFWVVLCVSKIRYNGLLYGFDFGIFQPDGNHYIYRTLRFLGFGENEAALSTIRWNELHGFKHLDISYQYLLPSNLTTWALVAPRVLYPLLSVPFVAVLGIYGMLVVPFLSFLGLLLVIYRISRIYGSPLLGVSLALVLGSSGTLQRWYLSDLTDGLLCSLFAVSVLIFMGESKGWLVSMGLALLVLATSATRFCFPIWVAIGIALFSLNQRRFAAIIGVFSILGVTPVVYYGLVASQSAAGDPVSGLTNFLVSMAKIPFYELGQLLVLDRALLVLLCGAFTCAVTAKRDLPAKFFLVALASVWFIGALNGTIGVNFRYQLPAIPFGIWVIIHKIGYLEKSLLYSIRR